VAKPAGGRRSRLSPPVLPGSSDGNRCGLLAGMRFALVGEWPSLSLRITRVPTPPLVPTVTSGVVRKKPCCIRRSRRTGLRFESAWKRGRSPSDERGGIARDKARSPIMRVTRPSNRHLPVREHRGPRAVETGIQEHGVRPSILRRSRWTVREGRAQRRRGGSCPTMTCSCGNRS
jgi:hypothetical protein